MAKSTTPIIKTDDLIKLWAESEIRGSGDSLRYLPSGSVGKVEFAPADDPENPWEARVMLTSGDRSVIPMGKDPLKILKEYAKRTGVRVRKGSL